MGKHSFDEKEERKKRNEQEDYEALKKLREEEKNKSEKPKKQVVEEEYDEDEDDYYEERGSKKGLIAFLIILVLLICAGTGGYFGWKYYKGMPKADNPENPVATEETAPVEEPVKQVQIYHGDQRPIACMIDNHKDIKVNCSIK